MHAPQSYEDWICIKGIMKKVPNNCLNKAAEALGPSVTRKCQISLGQSMQIVTVKAA